jgi:hypothetical protein
MSAKAFHRTGNRIVLLFLFLSFLAFPQSQASGEEATQPLIESPGASFATNVAGVPMLVPFRVWVWPKSSNGSEIAGHYEYFQMPGDASVMTVLSNPSLEPVMMPILPPQGDPAVPAR